MRQGVRWSGILLLLAFIGGAVFLFPKIYDKLAAPKDPLHEAALAVERASSGHIDVVYLELTDKVIIYELVLKPFSDVQSPEWLAHAEALRAMFAELREDRASGLIFIINSREGQYYAKAVLLVDLDCMAANALADECIIDYQPLNVIMPPEKLLYLGLDA